MTRYRPAPLDTSAVTMTTELQLLVEQLAENAHDTWATMRMSAGWRYGRKRNDKALRHPCLIPYAELSEDEREIDRQMVEATVRAILSLGYEIRLRNA